MFGKITARSVVYFFHRFSVLLHDLLQFWSNRIALQSDIYLKSLNDSSKNSQTPLSEETVNDINFSQLWMAHHSLNLKEVVVNTFCMLANISSILYICNRFESPSSRCMQSNIGTISPFSVSLLLREDSSFFLSWDSQKQFFCSISSTFGVIHTYHAR